MNLQSVDTATVYNLVIAIVSAGLAAFSAWHAVNARGSSAAAQKTAETALNAAANAASAIMGHQAQGHGNPAPQYPPGQMIPLPPDKLAQIQAILQGESPASDHYRTGP